MIHHDLRATRCKLYNANIGYFHLKFTCFTLIIKKLEMLRFMSSLIFLLSSVIFHKKWSKIDRVVADQEKRSEVYSEPRPAVV